VPGKLFGNSMGGISVDVQYELDTSPKLHSNVLILIMLFEYTCFAFLTSSLIIRVQ